MGATPSARGKNKDLSEQPRAANGEYSFKMGGDCDLLAKRETNFPSPFIPPEEMDLDDIAPLPEGVPDPLVGPRTFISVYDDVDDPWSPGGNRFIPSPDPVLPHQPRVDAATATMIAGEPEYPVSSVRDAQGDMDSSWAACGDVRLHNQLVESGVPFRPAPHVGHKVDGASYVVDTQGETWLLMRNVNNPGCYTLDNFHSRPDGDGMIVPFTSSRDLVTFLADTPGAGDSCSCPGDMCFC